MPNTLGHIGVQSLVTRTLIPDADPKWIYIGCIVPDVPWILQRIVLQVYPQIDPLNLRYYVDIQGSFLFSLIACIAIALFSIHFWKLCGILSANVFMHLILDALQTKWANGVHLFAPVSWELTSWNLFWPESVLDLSLTALGLVYLLVKWKSTSGGPALMKWPGLVRISIIFGLTGLYFVLPLVFLGGPHSADNHYLATRALGKERLGQYVEFDRASYTPTPDGGYIQFVTEEKIFVRGINIDKPVSVSVKGIFVTESTIDVTGYHVHSSWFRETASIVGLLLVFILWIQVAFRQFRSGHVKRVVLSKM